MVPFTESLGGNIRAFLLNVRLATHGWSGLSLIAFVKSGPKIFLLLFLGSVPCYSQSESISSKSTIEFEIRNLGLTVKGTFAKITGSVTFNEQNLNRSKVEIELDARTIKTGIDLRDRHLQKPDYLHANRFPVIRFVSTEITKVNDVVSVRGLLTMKGITRELSIPFKVMSGKSGKEFTGNFRLNRQDFDVGENAFTIADVLTVNFRILTILGESPGLSPALPTGRN